MSTAVRIPSAFIQEAKAHSKANSRSVASQITDWIRIGKIAQENPDLPYSMIKDILLGMEEFEQGMDEAYQFVS